MQNIFLVILYFMHFWSNFSFHDYWSKLDEKRKSAYISCKSQEICISLDSCVYPWRKVSLVISFSRWRNRFGKDEAFAEVHVTLGGRTRALTSAALIYKLLCVCFINQVKWWQFASNILPLLSSIHIYTHRLLPRLLGTVCVCVCARACVFIYPVPWQDLLIFSSYSNQFVWQKF